MKDLIVYFSLEGNTGYVADKIKSVMAADSLCLVPKKAYHDKGFAKFFWGGKSAVMAEKPELEDYNVNLNDYDRVIFGSPVWASNFAPPIRTFIEDHKEELKAKDIVAFLCQSGSGAEKAFAKLARTLGIDKIEKTAVFIDPKSKPDKEKDSAIAAFAITLK
jgi:flavodoxin